MLGHEIGLGFSPSSQRLILHGRRAAVPFGSLIYESGNNIWAWPGDTILKGHLTRQIYYNIKYLSFERLALGNGLGNETSRVLDDHQAAPDTKHDAGGLWRRGRR